MHLQEKQSTIIFLVSNYFGFYHLNKYSSPSFEKKEKKKLNQKLTRPMTKTKHTNPTRISVGFVYYPIIQPNEGFNSTPCD